MPFLPFAPMPDLAVNRRRDHDRRHPERETLELAKASITMAKADLWKARLAVKTLRRDQREAIAGVGED